jgi:acyl-CoA thioester hydrolase
MHVLAHSCGARCAGARVPRPLHDRVIDHNGPVAPSPDGRTAEPFVHHLRPRYAEIDAQGVVFNAHWLTYFDEASTRFFAQVCSVPAAIVFRDFDVMIVKVVVEWDGPARFEEDVAITVVPTRFGRTSFDLTYTATSDGRPSCIGTITYVSVVPGTSDPVAVPDDILRAMATATER